MLDKISAQGIASLTADRAAIPRRDVAQEAAEAVSTEALARPSLHLPSALSYCLRVLINLLPDFLAVLDAADREAAYRQYRESHRPMLDAYWRNYVLDPDSPHAGEIVAAALRADRSDLHALPTPLDLVQLAEDAIARAKSCCRSIARPTPT